LTRYELVIFDWDGTLMDSTRLIAACIQAACRDLGLAVPTEAEASWVIGLGLQQTLEKIAPGITPAQQKDMGARYRHHFLAREHEAPLFAGVRETLGELRARERRMAVATGKSRLGLDRAMAGAGLAGMFEITRCADEGFPKPHPDMLLHILDQTGVDAGRAVMIGDTTHDLELAANAGVDAVAVCYGAHDEPLLRERGARHFAGSVEDLRRWLANHA
jgi:phosphoglycolate phosphatase